MTGPVIDLDRRMLLSAMVGLAVVPVLSQAATPLAQKDAQSLAQIRWRTDGEPVFWLERGEFCLLEGGKAVPIYGRCGLTAARLQSTQDGGYQQTSMSLFVYTDATDGSIITGSQKNPYTGGVLTNDGAAPLRSQNAVAADGSEVVDTTLGDGSRLQRTATATRWRGLPGEDWFSVLEDFRITPATGSPTTSIEWSMYHAAATPAKAGFVPAETSLQVAQVMVIDGRQDTRFALGHYRGRKFSTAEEIANSLDASQKRAMASFFSDWRNALG